MTGTEMVPETSVSFEHLTQLMVREDFIEAVAYFEILFYNFPRWTE